MRKIFDIVLFVCLFLLVFNVSSFASFTLPNFAVSIIEGMGSKLASLVIVYIGIKLAIRMLKEAVKEVGYDGTMKIWLSDKYRFGSGRDRSNYQIDTDHFHDKKNY
jgi:hypothetical protein